MNYLLLNSNNFKSFLKVFFSLIILYQLIGISNISGFEYNADFYINETGNPAESINPSFLVRQFNDCSVDLNSYGDFYNSGAFTTDITYYSPNNTVLGSGHQDLNGNVYCTDFGIVSTDKTLDEFFNSKSSITHTATKGINYLRTKLKCDTSDEWLNISSNDSTRDVNGFIPNVYFYDNISGYADGSQILDATNFGICRDIKVEKFNDYLLAGGTGFHTLTFYYLFNSTNGYLNYNLDASSILTSGAFFINQDLWLIYPLSDSSSPTTLCASNTCSGQIIIDIDTIYVVMFLIQLNDQSGATNVNAPLVNTLDVGLYKPDWDCSDYSECVNGSQHRTCIDPLGKIPDSLEYQFCYSDPINSVYFGFEDYESESVWYNYIGWGCQCYGETKNVLYPDNWFISNPRIAVSSLGNQTGLRYDFLKMTSETAYEGDKSLKMWNIPPQLRIPDFTGFIGFTAFTDTGYISPTLAIDNNSWVDPSNAFVFNISDSSGIANNNVTFTGYNIESLIPVTATSLKNFTVVLRGEVGVIDTITLSCIKIDINGYESPCQSTSFGSTIEYRFIDFTDWALSQIVLGNFDRDDADTLKVIIVADGGSGTITLDWIPVNLEMYDPTQLTLVYENIICGNQSIGIFPDIRQVVDTDENTSIFVERNITLPSSFMSASFKVKKCVEPELKHSSIPICFEFTDHCYTHDESCNYESKGSITFYLKDSDGNFLHEIKSVVSYPNKWEIREYAIDSLQPNTEYTIGFAVEPESEVDPDYYCVYLDDVRIDIRNSPLVCESECNDNGDEIQRNCKETINDVCVVCEEIEILKSPNCMASQDVIDKILSCSDWCGCENFDNDNENYNTKFVGNLIDGCNETLHGIDKCCEYTEIEDSDYCIDFCEQLEAGKTRDVIQDILDSRGIGFLGNFVSGVFIVLMIVILNCAFISKKAMNGSWQGFVSLLIVEMLIMSILWVDFAFIGIIISVVMAFYLAKLMSSGTGTGNNN